MCFPELRRYLSYVFLKLVTTGPIYGYKKFKTCPASCYQAYRPGTYCPRANMELPGRDAWQRDGGHVLISKYTIDKF